MFKSIEIERFRSIRYAFIEGFSQINLFIGKNNCGKSSLLESLFLISGPSNPSLPVNVNLIRGYWKSSLNDLRLDFYNLDTTAPIHIKAVDGETRDLEIGIFEQRQNSVSLAGRDVNLLSNIEEGKYGLDLNFTINDEPFASHLRIDASKPGTTVGTTPKKYKESLQCAYLNPKFDFNTSIKGLEKILQNKDEHFIIEGLRIIEPHVKDFVFTGNDMLVDIGLPKRIPVNLMGDGARKIVALLTAVYNCKDGVLLVDEISNGFHHSVMRNLWEILVKAAIQNNTQMFVTTHDIDSIKGLRDAAVGKFDDYIAAFKLLRTKEDELKAYHYSLESLDYSINQDIEIR